MTVPAPRVASESLRAGVQHGMGRRTLVFVERLERYPEARELLMVAAADSRGFAPTQGSLGHAESTRTRPPADFGRGSQIPCSQASMVTVPFMPAW